MVITGAPAPAEEKRLATWGSEVPNDLMLDEKLLAEALKKVVLDFLPEHEFFELYHVELLI